jgi:slit protein 3
MPLLLSLFFSSLFLSLSRESCLINVTKLNYDVVYRTLESNNLTSLQKEAFESLVKLKHLTLGNNPLICDCHLGWLTRFVRRTPKTVSQPRCNSPYHLRDKTVDEVQESEFKCAGESFLLLLLIHIA